MPLRTRGWIGLPIVAHRGNALHPQAISPRREMPMRRRESEGNVRLPWLHPRDRLPCERKMTRGEGHEP